MVEANNDGSVQGRTMANDFKNTINTFHQGITQELREAQSLTSPPPRRKPAPEEYEEEEGRGQGIASFKHIHGGSITSFIERMHETINIKNIIKYNKSAYIINI
jgi:hypothetical protein